MGEANFYYFTCLNSVIIIDKNGGGGHDLGRSWVMASKGSQVHFPAVGSGGVGFRGRRFRGSRKNPHRQIGSSQGTGSHAHSSRQDSGNGCFFLHSRVCVDVESRKLHNRGSERTQVQPGKTAPKPRGLFARMRAGEK